MKRFYRLMHGDDDALGVAYARPYAPPPLPMCGDMKDWTPISLVISEGDFGDFLPSNLPYRICSEKLRGILDSEKSEADELQWLPVFVRRNSEERAYFVLHFPNPPDVLSKEHSVYSAGVLIKDVINLEESQNHDVFVWRGGGEIYLKVSDKVRRAIIAAGCTGCEFSRQPAH